MAPELLEIPCLAYPGEAIPKAHGCVLYRVTSEVRKSSTGTPDLAAQRIERLQAEAALRRVVPPDNRRLYGLKRQQV